MDFFAFIKAANAAVAAAIKANPSFKLMAGVSSAGIVGAALLGLTSGRADVAIFAVAFVVAFMFVLLAFVAANDRAPRSRKILAEFLAWAFSLAMLAGIVLMGSSYFICSPIPIRSDCPQADPRLRRVMIDDFRLLEDSQVRKVGVDYFLDGLALKSHNIIASKPIDQLGIPYVTTLSNFGRGRSGEIDLTIVAMYGTTEDTVAPYDTIYVKNTDIWWKIQKLVRGLKVNGDKAQVLRNFLDEHGIKLRDGGFPILWVAGCLTKEDVARGKGFIKVAVYDNISMTFFMTHAQTVTFQQPSTASGPDCPLKAQAG